MKLVNFFKMAVLAFAAAVVIGCEQQDPTGEGTGNGDGSTLNENLTFTLALKDVLANSVTITVSHDGATTDTWYGFVTTDTESDEEDLIKAEVKNLLEKGNGKITGLKKAKNTNDKISDLEASTDYRYIVTGLTSNGTSYGKPASLDFSTASSTPDGFTETDTWNIVRADERKIDNNGDQVEVFQVTTNCDTLYYVLSYPAYLLDSVDDGGYGYTHTDLVGDIVNTIDYFAQAGYPYNEILGSGSLEWQEPRLASGEYVVYAVGFQDNGKPTYTYSCANITIDEETAEPDYTKWLGTWKMTSTEAVLGGEQVSSATYTVNIGHYDNNYMYAVTGWEMEGAEVDWSEGEDGFAPEDLPFPVYYVDGELEFREYDFFPFASDGGNTATHYFGLYAIGNVTMDGERYENTVVGLTGYDYPMACTSEVDGNIELRGCLCEDVGLTIEYLAMGYMMLPVSGTDYVNFANYPMFFPITMEKVTDAGTASAAPMSVSQSKTFKFKKDLKDFKALKGLSLNEKKPMEPRQYKLVKKTSLR